MLTLVLFISILAIGFSHVQTTYRLQKATAENERLQVLNRKIAEDEITPRLQACLDSFQAKRWVDLAEMTEEQVWATEGFGETSREELRKLMRKHGIEFMTD